MNGQKEEALKQIHTALALGIRDARFFQHAGEIALASGDRPAAEGYVRQSAELNAPGSEQAGGLGPAFGVGGRVGNLHGPTN